VREKNSTAAVEQRNDVEWAEEMPIREKRSAMQAFSTSIVAFWARRAEETSGVISGGAMKRAIRDRTGEKAANEGSLAEERSDRGRESNYKRRKSSTSRTTSEKDIQSPGMCKNSLVRDIEIAQRIGRKDSQRGVKHF